MRLVNGGPPLACVRLTDTLPLNASLVGGRAAASSGALNVGGGTLTWQGAVSATQPVILTNRMTIAGGLTDPTVIVNTGLVNDGEGHSMPGRRGRWSMR